MNTKEVFNKLDEFDGLPPFNQDLKNIEPELFNEVIDVLTKDLTQNQRDAISSLKSLYYVEFNSLDYHTVEVSTKAYSTISSLQYIVGFYKSRCKKGAVTELGVDIIKEYFIFRRNRLISRILENPIRFNSTCIMSNVNEMFTREAESKVVKYFENIYIALVEDRNLGVNTSIFYSFKN